MTRNAKKSTLLLFIKTGAVTNLPPLRESRPEIPGRSEVGKRNEAKKIFSRNTISVAFISFKDREEILQHLLF